MAHRGRQSADEALAAALAAGSTLRDAARTAGVSERTAGRRAADPEFRAKVEAFRADLVAQALGKLAGLLADAAEALKRALTCQSPAVEVRAATATFDQLLEVRDQTVLEERLRASEDQLREARARDNP